VGSKPLTEKPKLLKQRRIQLFTEKSIKLPLWIANKRARYLIRKWGGRCSYSEMAKAKRRNSLATVRVVAMHSLAFGTILKHLHLLTDRAAALAPFANSTTGVDRLFLGIVQNERDKGVSVFLNKTRIRYMRY
jgi:hypothetical protein